MYGNVDAALLWLIILDKYLIKECNMTRIQAEYLILYNKDDGGKLDVVMSINVDCILMTGRLETLENIKEMIKLKFNIEYYWKVKRFLGVYCKWGHDAKGLYTKIIMDKDVNKLVDGCEKFTGSDVNDQKTPGAYGTARSYRHIKLQFICVPDNVVNYEGGN